ncbi:MAG: amidohydrolase family protein [Desulfovibrionaceae bacterium]
MDQPERCDALVTASLTLTQDHNRQVLEDAAVAVAAGRILQAGPAADLVARYAPDERIELGDCLLAPAFGNAHTHASMTLLRGLGDDMALMEWLEKCIWPVEMLFTPEIVELGASLACAEMLASGTGCFLDGYMFEDRVGAAVDAAGMRAVLGEGFFAFPSPHFPTAEHAWKCFKDLKARFQDHPRLSMAITPHATFSTRPDVLRESFELACELGVPWQIHAAETPVETKACLEKFGQRPIPYLRDLGVLSGRTILHHVVDVTALEIETIAASGAKVVHNPESNMKLCSGASPVQQLVQAGVVVALGTDGAASNNSLSMLTAMKVAALLAKHRTGEPSSLPARRVLDMATLNAYRCIYPLEDPATLPGAIEPGRPADLAAFRLDDPAMQPVFNPDANLVYSGAQARTAMTMVAGRVAYRDGEYAGIDMDSLLREVKKAAAWVRSRSA